MNSLAYGALWVFVFSLPWERIFMLDELNVVTRVTGGLALAAVLTAVVTSGRVRRWHLLHVAALAFWMWAGFGLLLFSGSPKIPDKYWTYGQLFLVLWMVWELAPTERRQRGLFLAYVLGGYVAALDTLRLFRTEAGVMRRFAAGGADPNDLAMVLALGLPMAWYLGMTYGNPILRWICRGYVPISLVAIGLTGSRGGLLATTAALLIVPLSMTRLSPGRMAMAIFLLGLAGSLAIAYTPETLIQRMATTTTELERGHIGGRGKIWKAGLEAFAQRPVFGYGTSGFINAVYPILGSMAKVAHNSFLSVLVEQGLVGLMLYLTMFLAVFRSVIGLRLLERRFALVLLMTLGCAMFPLTWEHRKVVWFILAGLLGFSEARSAAASEAAQQAMRWVGSVTRQPRAAWGAVRPAVLGRARGGNARP
jgi:O-antigen ligase